MFTAGPRQSPESSGLIRVRASLGSFFGIPHPSYPGPELPRITRAPNLARWRLNFRRRLRIHIVRKVDGHLG
eukprot:3176352-Pyramimonas_sp.AAC.1